MSAASFLRCYSIYAIVTGTRFAFPQALRASENRGYSSQQSCPPAAVPALKSILQRVSPLDVLISISRKIMGELAFMSRLGEIVISSISCDAKVLLSITRFPWYKQIRCGTEASYFR